MRWAKIIFSTDLFRRVFIHSISISILFFLLTKALKPCFSWIVGISIAGIGFLALREFYSMAEKKRIPVCHSIGSLGGSLFLFSSFLTTYLSDSICKNAPRLIPITLLIIIFSIMIARFFLTQTSIITGLSVSIFGVLYICIPLKILINILYSFSNTSYSWLGVWWAAFVIVVAKTTDVFAYFFGKFFGQKKLAFSISPNKTRLGFICGTIGATSVSSFFYFFLPHIKKNFVPSLFSIIIFGFLISISSSFGDLLESLFKRDCGVKDSSNTRNLPIGGILDNLDSLLPAILLTYFLMNVTYHP